MKKFLSLLLAAVTAASLTVTAFGTTTVDHPVGEVSDDGYLFDSDESYVDLTPGNEADRVAYGKTVYFPLYNTDVVEGADVLSTYQAYLAAQSELTTVQNNRTAAQNSLDGAQDDLDAANAWYALHIQPLDDAYTEAQQDLQDAQAALTAAQAALAQAQQDLQDFEDSYVEETSDQMTELLGQLEQAVKGQYISSLTGDPMGDAHREVLVDAATQ
jgi:peptidoglycan hydrolase CwlO-like protein